MKLTFETIIVPCDYCGGGEIEIFEYESNHRLILCNSCFEDERHDANDRLYDRIIYENLRKLNKDNPR